MTKRQPDSVHQTPRTGDHVKRTPFHSFHEQCHAKLVEFAGWEMPLLYTSIIEEHHYTRRVASIFDVSHMGRLEIHDQDAETFLQMICTRQLGDMHAGQSRYSHICNEKAGILDDVIVSRYEDHWLVVCNAANRERVLSWMRDHLGSLRVRIEDTTTATLMIAIQGPKAIERIGQMLPLPIDELKRYRFRSGSYMGTPYTVFRSGYTGEDGVEIILPANIAALVGGFLASDSANHNGLKPAGLGARDTLRLEAGMPLHGHELHDQIDSISADLAWCVDLEKDFIGADALRTIARQGPRQTLVGFELRSRRIARPGATILCDGRSVGQVTSGTFSPTLQQSIAMGYIDTDRAKPGSCVRIDLGSKQYDASIVKMPFYKCTKH